MKITKNTKISEVVEKYPETFEVFLNAGMHCFGCSIAKFETIEEGVKAHGFGNKEINKIIKELNLIIKKHKKS